MYNIQLIRKKHTFFHVMHLIYGMKRHRKLTFRITTACQRCVGLNLNNFCLAFYLWLNDIQVRVFLLSPLQECDIPNIE